MGFNPFAKKVVVATPAPKNTFAVRGSSSLGGSTRNRKQINTSLWDAYRNNVWANRCVSSIARAITKGYKLVSEDGVEEAVAPDAVLEFLNNPNPTDSFEELVGNIVTQMLVFGACYLEVQRQSLDANQIATVVAKALDGRNLFPNDNELAEEELVDAAIINGIPTAMQVLPAQQIEVVAKNGIITGFKQHTDDGRTIKFAPSEIVIMLYPGSMDKLYGDSPLEPISSTVANDTLIRKRQQAKLLNLLGLDHIISLPESTSDENVERVHETLSTLYRGAGAAGSFLVINAPAKVDHMDGTAEGDYLQLREMHKEEIALGLGVPLSVLGNTDGTALTGAGSSQHYRYFVENTCRPLAKHIQADLNELIIKPFEQLGVANVILELVLEDATDIQGQEEVWNTQLANGTATINEIRAQRGQEPVDGGDEAYINAKGVQVVSQLGQEPPAPVVPEPPEDDEDDANKAVINARAALRALRKAL